MNIEPLWTFISFALVASITPRPNNFMVMASAGAFDWRRTVPHILGMTIGFCVILGAVALVLGAVLIQFPGLLVIVKTCSAQPMQFHQAAVFQLVNPKTWTILIAVNAA